MNHLFGRLGINPMSKVTHIVDDAKFMEMNINTQLIFAEMLAENTHIVSYQRHTFSEEKYIKPTISAVQISAAITNG